MTSDDEQLAPGGVPIGDPVWESRQPAQLAALLRGVTAPWYVAAGWALDLFRGEQTREHEDLEIGLPNTAEAFGQARDKSAVTVLAAAMQDKDAFVSRAAERASCCRLRPALAHRRRSSRRE